MEGGGRRREVEGGRAETVGRVRGEHLGQLVLVALRLCRASLGTAERGDVGTSPVRLEGMSEQLAWPGTRSGRDRDETRA